MSNAPSSSPDAAASHWCYECNKNVVVVTLDDIVLCSECNKGFVESIQPSHAAHTSTAPPRSVSPDLTEDNSNSNSYILEMLRCLGRAPPRRSPPRPRQFDVPSYEDDIFRSELNGGNFIGSDESEDEDEEENVVNLTVNEEEETEATRSGRRNRIINWAEILMGIEDSSVDFSGESDGYTGNPDDYIDDGASYEDLLLNLEEEEDGGRRGAPPAAKSAIEALETFEVSSLQEGEMVTECAVCKEGMVMGETGKKLPCGHCYHGDCIVPWLGTRNSCPVCRFQLQTDDAEYEKERKNKTSDATAASSSSSH